MSIDLNVRIMNQEQLDSFIQMARNLGFVGFATTIDLNEPIVRLDDGFRLIKRVEIQAKTLGALKKRVGQVRRESGIVVVPIGDVQISNWAAEDARVDLLSLVSLQREHILKPSTAKMAAGSETVLEVPVYRLISSIGLERSKILKVYRESVETAINEGMEIIVTSAANEPILMRSPRAMQYFGLVLGLEPDYLRGSLNTIPEFLVDQNERKLGADFIAPGVEVVRRDEE